MSRFIRSFFISVLVVITCAAPAAAQAVADREGQQPSPAPASHHFPADEHLRPMLRYLVEDGQTPGMVLGVLEADGSTRVVSYGSGGTEARDVGPKSVFEIGSITKVFTTTLLADMHMRGEIASLDDPISNYLPDSVRVPSYEGKEITLRHLATHSSGLPRLPDNHTPADPENPYADYTAEKLYAFLSDHELQREPGSEMEYSNLGVGLLGHVLERIAGKPFKQLMRERVLDPLGMWMTGYALEGETAEWMTKGHRGGEVVPYSTFDVMAGAAGLRSNAEDMLKFLRANVGEPRTDLQRAMRAAQEPQMKRKEGQGVGLGWGIRLDGDRRIYMQNGGTAGFRTMIGFDTTKNVGFIQLANSNDLDDNPGPEFLMRGAVEGTEIEMPREVLASYAGEYHIDPTTSIIVRLEGDGALTAQETGEPRWRLYPETTDRFFSRRTPLMVTFGKDDSGAVVEMRIERAGKTRIARKAGPGQE